MYWISDSRKTKIADLKIYELQKNSINIKELKNNTNTNFEITSGIKK